MKRFQIFLAGAFIATGSLFAQSDNAEWQAGLAKMKELIQVNPAQASDEAGQLLKGKNKKNPELVVAVARAFLDAGKLSEAEEYLALAKKADNKSAAVSVLEGDIAIVQKDAGKACQMYKYQPVSNMLVHSSNRNKWLVHTFGRLYQHLFGQ